MAATKNKEKSLYKEIETKHRDSYDEHKGLYDRFSTYEKMYFSYQTNSENPWKSDVFDPEVFEKVERMVSHLFATRPRGKFMPREGADVAGVRIADELFKYQWEKPGQHMGRKLKRMGRSAGIFGTGIGTLHWRYERRKRNYKDSKGTQKSRYEVAWDDPYFSDLYIYNCFPDPSAVDIDDLQWFIHDEYTTIEALKANNHKHQGERRYKNLDILEQKAKKKNKGSVASELESYRQTVDDARGGTRSDRMKDRILVRRYFSRDKWVTLAPDYKLVIEDRPNPYDHGELPIHILPDVDYSDQLYGIGEVEPVYKLQRGLNAMLNQRLDNVKMALSPAVMVDPVSQYAHEWKWAPGRKWRVDKSERPPEIFQIPDVTGSTFIQSTNYMKDSMSRALGHQDFLSRNETADQKTATEVRAAAGEQNARMRAKEHNVDEFMARLGTQWMQLNQQYLTKARLVRIVGQEALDVFTNEVPLTTENPVYNPQLGTEEMIEEDIYSVINGKEVKKFERMDQGAFGLLAVEPKDIQGAMDFIVETASTTEADTSQEVADTESVIQTLSELESKLQNVRINYSPLVERLLSLKGIKNTGDIFEVLEEGTPEQMQAAGQLGQETPQPGMPQMGALAQMMGQGQAPQMPQMPQQAGPAMPF